MKIAVTGGAGFIGSNFLLGAAGAKPDFQFLNIDKLTYAARVENLAPLAATSNYSFAQIDLVDSAALHACLNDFRPEVIVHFAAESHVDRSLHAPGEFVRTNVLGTLSLLEWMRSESPSTLLQHVSTDEVYGSARPGELFVEESRYDPSSPYSASKAASDHLVRSYARSYGLRVRLSNCSNNYGPYQVPEKLIPFMISRAVSGATLPIYGKGENERDWLLVEDHCAALWRIIEGGEDGRTYNIGGKNVIRNLDLVHMICDILVEQLGEGAQAARSRIEFVADRPGHDLRYAIDCSRIEAELHFAPSRTFEQGLRDTIRWYLSSPATRLSLHSEDHAAWVKRNYAERSVPTTSGPRAPAQK